MDDGLVAVQSLESQKSLVQVKADSFWSEN